MRKKRHAMFLGRAKKTVKCSRDPMYRSVAYQSRLSVYLYIRASPPVDSTVRLLEHNFRILASVSRLIEVHTRSSYGTTGLVVFIL